MGSWPHDQVFIVSFTKWKHVFTPYKGGRKCYFFIILFYFIVFRTEKQFAIEERFIFQFGFIPYVIKRTL